MQRDALDPHRRTLLTFALMLAVLIQALDATIANVALPQMQASLGASQDSINWVLTSYIVASAIAIPVAGWFADRFGRKRLLVVGVVSFTVASLLCAIAQSLTEMVLFRALQGVSGSLLVPLAQSTLFDVYPREKHSQAMAIFGGGIMIGPILGPFLGGWLTDTFDWRWVFLVNLPIGSIAALMLLRYMPHIPLNIRKFDLLGFALLGLALTALQLLLDRGEQQDWFDSAEILIELAVACSAFWMFVVHTIWARQPLFDRQMFMDRNFSTGLLFMGITGVLMFAGLALMPPLLQRLYGYSVLQSGELTMPRGIGTLITMIAAGRLSNMVDLRVLVGVGMALMGTSLYMMTGFALEQGAEPIITSGLVQGLGLGLLFITIQNLAFGTLDPRFRTAAASLVNLSRSIGGAAGISIVTSELSRNTQIAHSDLASAITDQSAPVMLSPLIEQLGLPAQGAYALINAEINRQAAFIAYLDDFKLMMWVTFAAIPFILLLRSPTKGEPENKGIMIIE